MKKLSILLLVAVMAIGLTACGDDDLGVLFASDTESTLKVNNTSNTRIVLFASKLGSSVSGAGVLLGGVNGNAQNWGVPNVSAADGMFVLNIVAYSDYESNPSNPRIASSTLVYVDDMPATYTVSTGSVGDGTLKFYNQTENYVEIRGGLSESSPSWYSEPFTVLRPSENKTIYLQTGDYDIYPVLKIERKSGTKIVGLAEKKLDDLVNSYSFFKGNTQTITIPANTTQVDHTCAYITVVNNTEKGLRMVSGNTIVPNSLNRQVVNGGGESEYTLDVTGSSVSKEFSFTDTLGNTVASASSYSFETGQVYTITIPAAGSTATVAEQGDYETVYPE